MSGGVDLELNSVAQKVSGEPDGGIDSGGVTRKREVLLNEPHGSGGGSSVNGPSSTTTNNNNKKRVRRHNHHNNHKKQSLRKRIRRNTQPAPNNTNEFLMQEHDHLFHLDLDNEEWGDPNNPPPALGHTDDLNHQVHPPYFSSSEDEDAFLNQDFSAMYDVVHQERLSVMSKPELITEYQLLEERVESLERKLKSVGFRSSLKPDLINPLPPPQPEEALPLGFSAGCLRLIEEEVDRLREENRKLKADNRSLRKLCYNPIPGGHIVPGVNGGEYPTTDSGAGSGSGSDTATPEELHLNKMIKRL